MTAPADQHALREALARAAAEQDHEKNLARTWRKAAEDWAKERDQALERSLALLDRALAAPDPSSPPFPRRSTPMREHETIVPSFIALAEVDTSLSCDVGLVTDGADNPLSDRGYLNIGECEITLEGDDAARIGEAVAELWNGYRAGRLIEPTAMAEAVASARAEGVREGLRQARETVMSQYEGYSRNNPECEGEMKALSMAWAGIGILVTPPILIPGGSSDV